MYMGNSSSDCFIFIYPQRKKKKFDSGMLPHDNEKLRKFLRKNASRIRY